MGSIEILEPTMEPPAPPEKLAPRLEDLKGKRVGVRSNGWSNFGVYLQRFEERLTAELRPSVIVKGGSLANPQGRSQFPSRRQDVEAQAKEFDEFAEQVDCAVLGICA